MSYMISQIKEIETQIDENSLIAFDLDNTLITSNSYYGSINWEYKLIAKFIEEGLSYEQAHEQACMLWNEAQAEVQTILIENESSNLIKEWKNKACIIGLTARSYKIKDLTYESLKSNDIHFSSFLEHKLDILHQGVLYCDHRLKSDVLTRFINEVLIKKPKKIIVVDDKKENLDDFLNSKINQSYEIKCYHYLNDPYKETEFKI